ncbi:MAG TPA: tripartite tricarboxylate transporter TctB family protein [Caldimonas sp.]|nr:tripartite tricarboxylate transporter TctB family protein [Caldimonas sp.]
MRIKSERDFWSGLAFVVVGVAFAVASTHHAMGPSCTAATPCADAPLARLAQISARPGPGLLPLGLGVLLAISGALVLFKSMTLESEGGDLVGSVAWRPLAAVVGALVAFAVLIEPLGWAAAVVMLVAIAGVAMPGWRWQRALVEIVGLSLLAWLVLFWILKLPVPAWPVHG